MFQRPTSVASTVSNRTITDSKKKTMLSSNDQGIDTPTITEDLDTIPRAEAVIDNKEDSHRKSTPNRTPRSTKTLSKDSEASHFGKGWVAEQPTSQSYTTGELSLRAFEVEF